MNKVNLLLRENIGAFEDSFMRIIEENRTHVE